MPIEIREVVIKAEVRDAEDLAPAAGSVLDMENVVRECVEQVLRIIEDKKAR